MNRLTYPAAIGLAVALLAPGHALADDDRVELGGFVGTHIFSRTSELGQTDGGQNPLDDSLGFGMRMSYRLSGRLHAEGELMLSPTQPRGISADVMTIGWRAHARYDLTDARLRPFVVAGVGALTASPDDQRRFGSDTDPELHTGFGAMYAIEDSWGVRGDARWLLVPSAASSSRPTSDFELFIGLYKTFGASSKPAAVVDDDADGDGIADADDLCPNEPENLDGVRDHDGCPEAPADSRGGDDTGAEPLPPLEPPSDQDGDGLAGDDDRCPDAAEDVDGFEDTDGCPDPDNDGDGVADADDKCPLEAEVANGYQDADGCPDEVPATVARFTGTIEGIRFASGSAVILRSSNRTLDQAATVLLEYPALKVRIAGHTDNRGKHDRNVALSQRRADAVKKYLVGKGVAADRLEAIGFGPDHPTDTNDTAAGRAKNRRVEFALIN